VESCRSFMRQLRIARLAEAEGLIFTPIWQTALAE
jgi:hypothetical protein